MMNFKQLIKEKRNIILAAVAVLLIIFTAYQLKLVGIAVANELDVIETLESGEPEKHSSSQVVSTEENVLVEVQNTVEQEINHIIEQNIVVEDVVSNTTNSSEIENIILENVVENFITNNVYNESNIITNVIVENSIINNAVINNTVTNNTVVSNVVSNSVLENETSNILTENIVTNSVTNEFISNNVIDEEVEDAQNTVTTNEVENEIVQEEIVKIPSELSFDNGEYKVIVSAIKEDALKNITKVNVVPITAENNAAEYNNISMKLQNKVEEENQGKSEDKKEELIDFLAYDITLINKDGIEVEPDGNVNVSFEYFTIPEKVAKYSNADVSVVHFEENKVSGNIELKEFSEEEKRLNVETNAANQIKKIEFETTSFSTFTIKWSTANRTANIVVHYVDENGNELQGSQTTTINASTNTYTFANYAGTINGYSYKDARLSSITGDVVTNVTFSSSNYRYTVTFSNGTTQTISRSDTVSYNVYLIYQSDNSGKVASTLPVGSTASITASDVTNISISDLIGFSWNSQNISVATVTVDGATGIPTVKGIKSGTTTIVGIRDINGVTQKINWNVTIENKVTSQLIFEHQKQNNSDFANQDNYRPYAEYGFGSTEPTNVIKFVVVLADTDGKLKMNGSLPDVELPVGTIIPDSYVFDLGADKTLSIGENTFDGISVPGYSYAGAYAYFGWSSNSDTKDMAEVNTFRNFGKVSTNFPTYYSVVGFTTDRGVGTDYSRSTFGNDGTGYYAYNPTGVLMIVLKEVSENVAYRTFYRNNYNPGGTANNNIVDTTFANMVKGDWIADEYRYDYYGETIMTSVNPENISGPVGYRFVGWYDSVDQEGNGTGNLVITSQNMMINGKYYALVNEEKIIIKQNNNLYARWESVTGNITIQKTITGGLTASQISEVKSKLKFVIKNDSNEIVATTLPTEIIWNENVGQITILNLPINIPYTIEEVNAEVEGHTVEKTIIYPNNASYVQLLSENSEAIVTIENEYSTKILINKVNPFGELRSGASFEIVEANSGNARVITDLDDGNNDGKINISFIKYDTEYIITEKVAPNGHYIYKTPIHIKVKKVDGIDTIIILNNEEVSKNVSIENGALRVVNLRHVLMPKAGGCGTYWFYISGVFLMGSSIIIYFKNKNRKEI